MSKNPQWGVGSNHYKKRPRLLDPTPGVEESGIKLPSRISRDRVEATGLSWDSKAADWSMLKSGSVDRAVARYRHQLSSHVWDAAVLEGNTFTLPEVQTLLEGVTVGGHRQEEANQVIALAESSSRMAQLVVEGEFGMNR